MSTHKVLMLIRREIWENRSLWIAPLVLAGVILFSAAFGGVHVGRRRMAAAGFGHITRPTTLQSRSMPGQRTRRRDIYGTAIAVLTVIAADRAGHRGRSSTCSTAC